MRADEHPSDAEKVVARIIESKFYITGGKPLTYYTRHDTVRQTMKVRIDCENFAVSHTFDATKSEVQMNLEISLMLSALAGEMLIAKSKEADDGSN